MSYKTNIVVQQVIQLHDRLLFFLNSTLLPPCLVSARTGRTSYHISIKLFLFPELVQRAYKYVRPRA